MTLEAVLELQILRIKAGLLSATPRAIAPKPVARVHRLSDTAKIARRREARAAARWRQRHERHLARARGNLLIWRQKREAA